MKNTRFDFSEKGLLNIETETNDEYGVAIEDFNDDGVSEKKSLCLFKQNLLLINHRKKDLILMYLIDGSGYFRNVSSQEKRATEEKGRWNSAALVEMQLDQKYIFIKQIIPAIKNI